MMSATEPSAMMSADATPHLGLFLQIFFQILKV
jgi:hypothetical protein